ncbi:MAG: hypothetical protein NXI24_09785 [bacterium]|nr:hypothetical protein [bacterium]
MQKWNALTGDTGANLKEARLQLHHAVQPLAAAGAALIPARPDYTHTSLEYDAAAGAFVGAIYGDGGTSGRAVRGAFYFEDFSLALITDGVDGADLDRATLIGKTFEESFAWFAAALKKAGFDQDLQGRALALSLPEYPDYPEHGLVTANAKFDADLKLVAEVQRYFSNTMPLLQSLVDQHKGASPITVWPHHFDMATLITLKEPTEAGGEDGHSVGAGLSPGDMGNDAPYWYVTPWPYPDKDKLPALPAGRWNTDGWVGAQLDAREVLAVAGGAQAEVVGSYLQNAVQASVDLISSK